MILVDKPIGASFTVEKSIWDPELVLPCCGYNRFGAIREGRPKIKLTEYEDEVRGSYVL